jgi:clan AA aspartic protease (TIGR02281 family)
MLVFTLIALFAAGGNVASASPAATQFLARVHAADKARKPHSETEDWSVAAFGLTGHEHNAFRGNDDINVSVLGPFTTESGTLRGTSWHQNENGYTIVSGNRPETDELSTVPIESQTVARVHYPLDAYLVTTVHSNGVTERDYFAPSDYLLLRQEYQFRKQTTRIDYSDIRKDRYGRRAWHRVASDGQPGNVIDARLQSVVENPALDDATFAIPPTRRTLVEFPDGIDTSRISTDTEGHLYTDVIINGHQITMALDTGASSIVLDSEAAKELGLQTYGKATQSVAGRFQTSRVIAPLVQVGDLSMHNVVMNTAPLDWSENGHRVLGLLGFDFIAGTVLRVDYEHHTVDAFRPSAFTVPELATAQTAIRLDLQVPVVTVGVGNAQSTEMILDTGAAAPVLFFDRFVRLHPDAMRDEGLGSGYNPDDAYVGGVGGYVHIVPLRLSSFRFAGLNFKNFIVIRAEQNGAFGVLDNDGLLGALFLRYFTLYIDYPNQKIYFEPNENYNQALDHQ